jgi:hypothetical protein
MGCSIHLAQVDSMGAGAFTRMIPLHGISARKFGVLVMIWCRCELVPLLAFEAQFWIRTLSACYQMTNT